MGLLDWFRKGAQGTAIRAQHIEAVRAMYNEGDGTERVELHIRVEGDQERLILDLSTKQVADLIRQMTAAHDAIHPPLRRHGN